MLPLTVSELLLVFNSANLAVKAESALSQAGLAVRVMNLPSSIKAGCGLCLRLAPEDLPRAKTLLREAGAPFAGLYTRKVQNGGAVYASAVTEGPV